MRLSVKLKKIGAAFEKSGAAPIFRTIRDSFLSPFGTTSVKYNKRKFKVYLLPVRSKIILHGRKMPIVKRQKAVTLRYSV